MRHLVLNTGITALLLLLVLSSHSQVGIKAGIGISDIVFSDEGQTPYLGYEVNYLTHRIPLTTCQFGAFANIGKGSHFDFQPELLIILQGLGYNTGKLYDDIKYHLRITYLSMPLLLRVKTIPKRKTMLVFEFGPYGSLKLKANKITEFEGDRNKTSPKNIKAGDLGFIAGLGLENPTRSGQLFYDLRASYSLINIMDTLDGYIPSYDGPSKLRARNISFTLSVGYRFNNLGSRKDQATKDKL